jgi:hypothetical protein
MRNGSEYWCWEMQNNCIYRAVSADGLNWTMDSQPALQPGASGSWDSDDVSPSYVLRDDRWYLFYVGDHDFENDRGGWAWSADGLNWTRQPDNPILPPGPGYWDSHQISTGSVLRNGNIFQMWYNGNHGSYGSGNAIGYAHSSVPNPIPVRVGDHFCLHFLPNESQTVFWCCPLEGPPHFTWTPGCQSAFPGCQESCIPYGGPVTWTAQYDSSSAECSLPGGWWSARFTAQGEGCVCMSFDWQEPVELMNFTAAGSNGHVTLTWITASERNNDRFEIHRSSEGTVWSKIGVVSGHGTSSTTHHYAYSDETVQAGTTYSYRLATVDINGAMEWAGDIVTATPTAADVVPSVYALHQNHPNPFNPSTEIVFEIAEAGPVALNVFNVAGQEVATLLNGLQSSGLHHVTFDGSALPSGVYFYTLSANGFTATRKMMLMK